MLHVVKATTRNHKRMVENSEYVEDKDLIYAFRRCMLHQVSIKKINGDHKQKYHLFFFKKKHII